MLDLTVDKYGYLTADASEWLASIGDHDEALSESYRAFAEANLTDYADRYASEKSVVAWVKATYGDDVKVTGIYGEDGPVSEALCNVDSFIDDISFTFIRVDGTDRDDEMISETFIVETGRGYYAHTHEYVDVYRFTGYDDADAFSYASGFASHATEECGAEWLLENTVYLYPNGGGEQFRVEDYIVEPDGDDLTDEEAMPFLQCPDCGDKLLPTLS